MSKHVQCSLSRGREHTTRWIPKSKARIGAFVDLQESDKSWSRGWCVTNTYSEMDSELVLARAQDHKNHRKATDV